MSLSEEQWLTNISLCDGIDDCELLFFFERFFLFKAGRQLTAAALPDLLIIPAIIQQAAPLYSIRRR